MRSFKWWMAAAAVALLALSPALTTARGQEDQPKKVKKARPAKEAPAKKSALRGEYSIMASELKLDEAQQAKLKEVLEARDAALKAWRESADGQKMVELSKAAAEAKKAGNKDEMKKISEQMKSLREEQMKLEESHKAKIADVLTDTQKAQWEGFVLYRSVAGRYKGLNLEEAQQKQIRDLTDAAAKAMPASSDRKARAEAMKKLSADIEEKVLTDAQKQELKAKQPAAKDKPAGEAKPGARKAGKKAGDAPAVVE